LITPDERITMNDHEIQQAATRRDAAKSQLYRADGRPVFGEQEHRERERAIDQKFREDMERVESQIQERVERARGELASVENADPGAALTTDELTRAAALNQFVSEEAATLSLADLARRCRVAAASPGDKAAMYAMMRHAARRADEDLSGEVRDAVAELRRALDPDREEKAEAARQALEEAEDLRFRAQMALVGANNLGDAFFGGGQGPSSYWGAAS
jgi:hypothetical protein